MNRLKNLTVSEIVGVYTPSYYEKTTRAMHERPSYGFSIAIDGESTYTHNQKTYVSDNKHIIFLPKGATYEFNCYKPGAFTLVNFQCPPPFNCNEFLRIPISSNEEFYHIHRRMTQLHLFETGASHYELLSYFYRMLAEMHTDATKQTALPLIKKGIKYMEENISNPSLSNDALAKAAGVSEIYFRKLFKAEFGITPHSYMQQIRINKAKLMLQNNNDSTEDICAACGYSNIYYFFKVFKEKTGYTPTEYREKYYGRNL